MFSTERLRVSVPERPPKLALSPILTPSISMAVLKAAFPAVLVPERRERTVLVVRSGFSVFPPGRRAAIPPILFIWR